MLCHNPGNGHLRHYPDLYIQNHSILSHEVKQRLPIKTAKTFDP